MRFAMEEQTKRRYLTSINSFKRGVADTTLGTGIGLNSKPEDKKVILMSTHRRSACKKRLIATKLTFIWAITTQTSHLLELTSDTESQ